MGKVTDKMLHQVAKIADQAYENDGDISWAWYGLPDREKCEQMQYEGDLPTEE